MQDEMKMIRQIVKNLVQIHVTTMLLLFLYEDDFQMLILCVLNIKSSFIFSLNFGLDSM